MARLYGRTRNPRVHQELERLSLLLLELDNVEVLENAVERRDEMHETEVEAALTFLEQCSQYKLPFKQFREALLREHSDARWQLMKVALNGIMLVLGLY
jgi:hypothetical protein